MDDLILLVLVALICLAIGFISGYLVSDLRAGKEAGRREAAPSQRVEFLPGDPQGSKPAPPPFNRPEPSPAALTDSPAPTRPGLNPLGTLARAIRSNKPVLPSGPKSIADQVDEILQEKLAGGTLASLPEDRQAVRLLDLPGKGLAVLVGLEQYEGIEAVPETVIRDLIQEAAGEWEQRASGG